APVRPCGILPRVRAFPRRSLPGPWKERRERSPGPSSPFPVQPAPASGWREARRCKAGKAAGRARSFRGGVKLEFHGQADQLRRPFAVELGESVYDLAVKIVPGRPEPAVRTRNAGARVSTTVGIVGDGESEVEHLRLPAVAFLAGSGDPAVELLGFGDESEDGLEA